MVRQTLTSVFTAVYLLSSVVFAYSAESNFWADRQKNLQSDKKKVQLAGVPASFGSNSVRPNELLNQLPEVQKINSQLSNRIASLRLPRMFSSYLTGIPFHLGTIKEIELGKLSAAKSGAFVILVQDVHLNNEAQKNIVKILLALNEEATADRQILRVGVEGAFGPFDFEPFRLFENKELRQSLADYFIEKNKIAAPSYAGLVADNLSSQYWGVDDPSQYQANVNAYKNSIQSKVKLQKILKQADSELKAEKIKNLNSNLKSLDQTMAHHLGGKIGFADYVLFLVREWEKWSTTDESGDSSLVELDVEQFLAAYDLEKNIDFHQVEKERGEVVKALAEKITEGELKQLAAEGVAFQMGKMSFSDYYRKIKKLIEDHGVSLVHAPSFDKYIRYVLLSDGIKVDSLMEAVNRLERFLLQRFIESEQEKDLMSKSEQIYLVSKLLEFGLTSKEWEKYKSALSGDVEWIGFTKGDLDAHEQFYLQADLRSQSMAQNLIQNSKIDKPMVLVAGGFHTEQLAKEFKKQGLSYAVVQPKLTKIETETGAEYLSIFAREKSPLDKLFSGEKLFLAPAETALGTSSRLSQGTNRAFSTLLAGIGSLLSHKIRIPEKWGLKVRLLSEKLSEVTVPGIQQRILVARTANGESVGFPVIEQVSLGNLGRYAVGVAKESPRFIFNRFWQEITNPITGAIIETTLLTLFIKWIEPNIFVLGSMAVLFWMGHGAARQAVHQLLKKPLNHTLLLNFISGFLGSVLLFLPFAFDISFFNSGLISGAIHLFWNSILAVRFGVPLLIIFETMDEKERDRILKMKPFVWETVKRLRDLPERIRSAPKNEGDGSKRDSKLSIEQEEIKYLVSEAITALHRGEAVDRQFTNILKTELSVRFRESSRVDYELMKEGMRDALELEDNFTDEQAQFLIFLIMSGNISLHGGLFEERGITSVSLFLEIVRKTPVLSAHQVDAMLWNVMKGSRLPSSTSELEKTLELMFLILSKYQIRPELRASVLKYVYEKLFDSVKEDRPLLLKEMISGFMSSIEKLESINKSLADDVFGQFKIALEGNVSKNNYPEIFEGIYSYRPEESGQAMGIEKLNWLFNYVVSKLNSEFLGQFQQNSYSYSGDMNRSRVRKGIMEGLLKLSFYINDINRDHGNVIAKNILDEIDALSFNDAPGEADISLLLLLKEKCGELDPVFKERISGVFSGKLVEKDGRLFRYPEVLGGILNGINGVNTEDKDVSSWLDRMYQFLTADEGVARLNYLLKTLRGDKPKGTYYEKDIGAAVARYIHRYGKASDELINHIVVEFDSQLEKEDERARNLLAGFSEAIVELRDIPSVLQSLLKKYRYRFPRDSKGSYSQNEFSYEIDGNIRFDDQSRHQLIEKLVGHFSYNLRGNGISSRKIFELVMKMINADRFSEYHDRLLIFLSKQMANKNNIPADIAINAEKLLIEKAPNLSAKAFAEVLENTLQYFSRSSEINESHLTKLFEIFKVRFNREIKKDERDKLIYSLQINKYSNYKKHNDLFRKAYIDFYETFFSEVTSNAVLVSEYIKFVASMGDVTEVQQKVFIEKIASFLRRFDFHSISGHYDWFLKWSFMVLRKKNPILYRELFRKIQEEKADSGFPPFVLGLFMIDTAIETFTQDKKIENDFISEKLSSVLGRKPGLEEVTYLSFVLNEIRREQGSEWANRYNSYVSVFSEIIKNIEEHNLKSGVSKLNVIELSSALLDKKWVPTEAELKELFSKENIEKISPYLSLGEYVLLLYERNTDFLGKGRRLNYEKLYELTSKTNLFGEKLTRYLKEGVEMFGDDGPRLMLEYVGRRRNAANMMEDLNHKSIFKGEWDSVTNKGVGGALFYFYEGLAEAQKKDFRFNVFFQVPGDGSTDELRRSSFVQLWMLCEKLSAISNSQKTWVDVLREHDFLSPEINLMRDEYLGPQGKAFESWRNFKKLALLANLMQRKELMKKIQKYVAPHPGEFESDDVKGLSESDKKRIYKYFLSIILHPGVSRSEAVAKFIEDPMAFFGINDNSAALQNSLLASRYFQDDNIDLDPRALRDALILGKLDSLQVFQPHEIDYYVDLGFNEDLNKLDKVQLIKTLVLKKKIIDQDSLKKILKNRIQKRRSDLEKQLADPKRKDQSKISGMIDSLDIFNQWIDSPDYENGKVPGPVAQVLQHSRFTMEDLIKDGLVLKTQRYKIRIIPKSDPQAAVTGDEAPSCMGFGTSKNTHYVLNPLTGFIAISQEDKMEDGRVWERILATSVLSPDRKIPVQVAALMEKLRSERDMTQVNLYQTLGPEFLDQISGDVTIAADNVEAAPNAVFDEKKGGMKGFEKIVELGYTQFFESYLKKYFGTPRGRPFNRGKMVVGLSYGDFMKSLPPEENYYFPEAPLIYSDKLGSQVGTISINPGAPVQGNIPDPKDLDGVRPLSVEDVLEVAYLENRIYEKSLYKNHIGNIETELIAATYNEIIQGKERRNMSYGYFVKGKLVGYVIAYAGKNRVSKEEIIYVSDFAVMPEFRNKLPASKLLQKLMLSAQELARDRQGQGKETIMVFEARTGEDGSYRLFGVTASERNRMSPDAVAAVEKKRLDRMAKWGLSVLNAGDPEMERTPVRLKINPISSVNLPILTTEPTEEAGRQIFRKLANRLIGVEEWVAPDWVIAILFAPFYEVFRFLTPIAFYQEHFVGARGARAGPTERKLVVFGISFVLLASVVSALVVARLLLDLNQMPFSLNILLSLIVFPFGLVGFHALFNGFSVLSQFLAGRSLIPALTTKSGAEMPFSSFPEAMSYRSPRSDPDVIQAIDAKYGLIINETPDAVDAQLAKEAKKRKLPYLRLVIRNRRDLNHLETTVVLHPDGRLEKKEGRLINLMKRGKGILFIDYTNSNPKLVEEFNSLFDKNPYYSSEHGKIFTPELTIVGVMNAERVKKHPASFFSRFVLVKHMEYRFVNVADPVNLVSSEPNDLTEKEEVELFESPWVEEALVAEYEMSESGDVAILKGALIRAIEGGRPLVIKGGDWSSQSLLSDFIRQLIVKAEFEYNGGIVTVPPSLKIYRSVRKYDHSTALVRKIGSYGKEKILSGTWVVNRENYDFLFKGTEIRDGRAIQAKGVLDEPAVSLLVTDELPKWVWNTILHSKNKVEVQLVPGVQIPSEYKRLLEGRGSSAPKIEYKPWEEVKNQKTALIEGPDEAYIEARIQEEFPGQAMSVINVTPHTTLDQLVSSIEIRNNGRRVFLSQPQEMISALRDGKTVVINGLDANPELAQQLQSVLYDDPYLIENNQAVRFSAMPGRLVIVSKTTTDYFPGVPQRFQLNPDDKKTGEILKREFSTPFAGGSMVFSEDDYARLLKIKEIFSTIPPPPIGYDGLYPKKASFSLSRLRMLYRFDNWVEAFQNVFIDAYSEDPEVAAFMRVVVRLVFEVEEPARDSSKINGPLLFKVLAGITPEKKWEEKFWQLADSLGLDLLKGLELKNKFSNQPTEPMFTLIRRALIKNSSGSEKETFYREGFRLTGAVEDAPALESVRPAQWETWEDRMARIEKIMRRGILVMLKGAPGTGKSFITRNVARRLGYEEGEIEGPVTVGVDSDDNYLLRRRDLADGNTLYIDQPIGRWKKKIRGLLIIDEANLPRKSPWSSLRGFVTPNRAAILTGNQDYLTGRYHQELIEEEGVTVYFPQFEDNFLRIQLDRYVRPSVARRGALIETLIDLHNVFMRVGAEKSLSLRDLQELADRVNVRAGDNWKTEDVVFNAWNIYQGLYSEEERVALKFLISMKFGTVRDGKKMGISIDEMEKERIRQIVSEHKTEYEKNGIAFVEPVARMVGNIKDFLNMRQDRLVRKETDEKLGKRGVIFEGPSARGKDLVLRRMLEDEGFVDGDKPENKSVEGTRKYYYLNASLKYDELVGKIQVAQRNGSIIVLSEMNLLPSGFIEGKLNDVLTGNAREGFALFATINSSDFSGREKLSSALQNRVIYMRESDYNNNELAEIALKESGGRLDEKQVALLVRAHAWVRSRIKNPIYRPTTRDLINAVHLAAGSDKSEGSLMAVFEKVYVLYLKIFLGIKEPLTAEKIGGEMKGDSIDNILVIQKLGDALIQNRQTPLNVEIDKSNSDEAGGYYQELLHKITLHAAGIAGGTWQGVFKHEASHGMFTRTLRISHMVPNGDDPFDPVWQDMEDLRHLAAFDRHFPFAFMSQPTRLETLFLNSVMNLNYGGLTRGWSALLGRSLDAKQLFQIALLVYAKLPNESRRSDFKARMKAMAELTGREFGLNPFDIVIPHLDTAHKISLMIPMDLTNEDEIQYQQYRAVVLMNTMKSDYMAIVESSKRPKLFGLAHREKEAEGILEGFKQTPLAPEIVAEENATAFGEETPAGPKIDTLKVIKKIIYWASPLTWFRMAVKQIKRLAQFVAKNKGAATVTVLSMGVIIWIVWAVVSADGTPDSIAPPFKTTGPSWLEKFLFSAPDGGLSALPVLFSIAVIAFFGLAVVVFSVFMTFAARNALRRFGWGGRRGLFGFGKKSGESIDDIHGWREFNGQSSAHRIPLLNREEEKSGRFGIPIPPKLAERSTYMKSLSELSSIDLRKIFEEYFEKRLQPGKGYGTSGILDVVQFLRDPTRAWIKSTPVEEKVRRKVVLVYDEHGSLAKTPSAIVNEFVLYLTEKGFEVLELEKIFADSYEDNSGYSLVNLQSLRKELEAIYFYAAARRLMEEEKIVEKKRGEELPSQEKMKILEELTVQLDLLLRQSATTGTEVNISAARHLARNFKEELKGRGVEISMRELDAMLLVYFDDKYKRESKQKGSGINKTEDVVSEISLKLVEAGAKQPSVSQLFDNSIVVHLENEVVEDLSFLSEYPNISHLTLKHVTCFVCPILPNLKELVINDSVTNDGVLKTINGAVSLESIVLIRFPLSFLPDLRLDRLFQLKSLFLGMDIYERLKVLQFWQLVKRLRNVKISVGTNSGDVYTGRIFPDPNRPPLLYRLLSIWAIMKARFLTSGTIDIPFDVQVEMAERFKRDNFAFQTDVRIDYARMEIYITVKSDVHLDDKPVDLSWLSFMPFVASLELNNVSIANVDALNVKNLRALKLREVSLLGKNRLQFEELAEILNKAKEPEARMEILIVEGVEPVELVDVKEMPGSLGYIRINGRVLRDYVALGSTEWMAKNPHPNSLTLEQQVTEARQFLLQNGLDPDRNITLNPKGFGVEINKPVDLTPLARWNDLLSLTVSVPVDLSPLKHNRKLAVLEFLNVDFSYAVNEASLLYRHFVDPHWFKTHLTQSGPTISMQNRLWTELHLEAMLHEFDPIPVSGADSVQPANPLPESYYRLKNLYDQLMHKKNAVQTTRYRFMDEGLKSEIDQILDRASISRNPIAIQEALTGGIVSSAVLMALTHAFLVILGKDAHLFWLFVSLIPLTFLGSLAILAWFMNALGTRAGPAANIPGSLHPFLARAALDSSQNVSFIEVDERRQLRLNKNIAQFLSLVPVWIQGLFLHGFGVIGHETMHMKGRGELGAYGLSQILPGLAGGVLFGGMALLMGLPMAAVSALGFVGAFISVTLVSIQIEKSWSNSSQARIAAISSSSISASGDFDRTKARELLEQLLATPKLGLDQKTIGRNQAAQFLTRQLTDATEDPYRIMYLLQILFKEAGVRTFVREGALSAPDKDLNSVSLNIRYVSGPNLAETRREIDSYLRQRSKSKPVKLMFIIENREWLDALQNEFEADNVAFAVEDENVQAAVERFAPQVNSINVLVPRRSSLSEVAINSLRELQNIPKYRVTVYLLLEDALQTAVQISIQELLDLQIAKERLIATQA